MDIRKAASAKVELKRKKTKTLVENKLQDTNRTPQSGGRSNRIKSKQINHTLTDTNKDLTDLRSNLSDLLSHQDNKLPAKDFGSDTVDLKESSGQTRED